MFDLREMLYLLFTCGREAQARALAEAMMNMGAQGYTDGMPVSMRVLICCARPQCDRLCHLSGELVMLHNKLGSIYRDQGKNKDPVCNQQALDHFLYVKERDLLHDGVRAQVINCTAVVYVELPGV